jgi:RNA polymerase sigma factor, sigma-70 family
MDASPTRGPRLWARRTRPVKDVDDDQMVAELYREYRRPLLSFVMKQVGGDRQWAEDVVQETMIRAWRSADQLDGESGSLMPWLATVARRVVIDDRRRKAPAAGAGERRWRACRSPTAWRTCCGRWS